MLLSNLAKIVLVFSKTGRDYQPPAPVLCEIFLGMAWGVQNMGMGEGKGRICLGKPCFSGFFSYSSNYSKAPEGVKMRGWRGMRLGAPQIKKELRKRIPEPFGGHYWGVDMFKIEMTRTATVSVRRKMHTLSGLF